MIGLTADKIHLKITLNSALAENMVINNLAFTILIKL
jgi:hypothetical protein